MDLKSQNTVEASRQFAETDPGIRNRSLVQSQEKTNGLTEIPLEKEESLLRTRVERATKVGQSITHKIKRVLCIQILSLSKLIS